MSGRVYHVLFLCTGNSARSILAEALLNHWGQGRFVAHSAGSMPTGRVNPLALATLQQRRIACGTPRSKSWDEFAHGGAGECAMDLIITVCDNAAGEMCPVWPGHPVTAHWGVPDPAAAAGSEASRRQAFAQAFDTLQVRVRALAALPMEALDPSALKLRLSAIGRLDSSPAPGDGVTT